MIERVDKLLQLDESFALETTLSTRSYKNKLILASALGFKVKLLFFWLPTVEMAIDRVATRVSEGGHNIPKETIERRYSRGIENLFNIYLPLCDKWDVFDNSEKYPKIIAEGDFNNRIEIFQIEIWQSLKDKYYEN
jgi:predicted ABC-type ATPase